MDGYLGEMPSQDEVSYWMWWDNLRQDFQYALRRLRQSPGFAASAAITLALGIGANTAIFGIIDDTLLRPLPLPEPQQLVAIYSFDKKTANYVSTSYPDYEDFSQRARSFQELSAYVRLPLNLTIGEHAERIPVEAVTANYFSMLELPPVQGRAFRAEDDASATAAPVAMIGEELWNERFQRDPRLIGKTIVLEDHPFTVAGIVPKRYRGTNLNWSAPPQVWILLRTAPLVLPRLKTLDILHRRAMRWLLTIGRLKPGATAEQAQAELRILAADLARAEPATNRDITSAAFPASRAKFWPAYRTAVTESLAVFAGAAALVLILACANVSNLLLERGLGRRREIAIRLSVGASRSRIIRQLLAENLLLILLSFLAALLVASGLQSMLLQFPNAFGIPLSLGLTGEPRVLGFCFSISLVTTVLFGLAPALQTTRPDLLPTLKESGNSVSGSDHEWLRSSLVVVQVAFSMVLLVAGGLFTRSLLKAYSTDLGFRSANLLTMAFDLPPGRYSGQGGRHFLQALVPQILSVPGVQSATVARERPLSMLHSSIQVAGASGSNSAPVSADYNVVGPDYLETMGIALEGGRDFTSADGFDSAKVVIINQTLARRLWNGVNPVGRTILLQEHSGQPEEAEVAGVAHDSKYTSPWEQAQPYLYLPAEQSQFPAGHLIVRTRVKPETLLPAIRQQWDAIAPGVPLYDIHTGDEEVGLSLAPQRLASGLLVSFGVLAVLLASVGLYSLMAYSVMRRTREIGIRIALGARPEIIVRQILARAISLAVIGVVFGLAVSLGLMRFVASLVRDVSPYDTLTFALVILLLMLISLAAALIPAVRVARIDPLAALRCE